MNQIRNFLIGVVMTVIGGALFLRNITVSAGGNGMLGDFLATFLGSNGADAKSVTGILMVLVFTMLIIVFIKPNVITIGGLILSALIFMFSIIAGMEITLADMTALELAIVVGMTLAGLGLTIRSLTTNPSKDELDIDF